MILRSCRKIAVFFLLLLYSVSYSQVTLINTATTDNLQSISVIQKNILIIGQQNYLAKSYNECATLSLLPLPIFSNSSYIFDVCRVDTTIFYLSANSLDPTYEIWKSNDGGYNWIKKFDTTSLDFDPYMTRFFDAQNGISIANNLKTLLTADGLNTWSLGAWDANYPTCATIYGDSTIILGDGLHGEYLSKDRGHTWLGVGPTYGNPGPNDFAFLNKDTIFGIANPQVMGFESYFLRSFNGGTVWDYKLFYGNPQDVVPPDQSFRRLCVKKNNEVYIVAHNDHTGYGEILKTADLGQTWSTFTTPYKEYLNDMKFINDSIALVCGSHGLLFKWNTKRSLFTGVKENDPNELQVTIYPNPVTDKLTLDGLPDKAKISLVNVLGETVYAGDLTTKTATVNLSSHAPGIYYLKIQSSSGQKTFKIIKE